MFFFLKKSNSEHLILLIDLQVWTNPQTSDPIIQRWKGHPKRLKQVRIRDAQNLSENLGFLDVFLPWTIHLFEHFLESHELVFYIRIFLTFAEQIFSELVLNMNILQNGFKQTCAEHEQFLWYLPTTHLGIPKNHGISKLVETGDLKEPCEK